MEGFYSIGYKTGKLRERDFIFDSTIGKHIHKACEEAKKKNLKVTAVTIPLCFKKAFEESNDKEFETITVYQSIYGPILVKYRNDDYFPMDVEFEKLENL